MATKNWGVEAIGIKELRRDIKRAIAQTPREMSQAIKEAGAPALVRTIAHTPRKSGRLAGGWRVSAAGTVGSLTNRVPYAGGAVWGKRGKWRGFAKYGQPPRFAPPGIEDARPEIERILMDHLKTIVTFYGWARLGG